jgi:hypothetical protein
MQVQQWNPNFPLDKDRRTNFAAIFIAKRKSGKTHLINHFINDYLWNKYDIILVFTNAAGVDEYREFIDTPYIFPEFRPDIVDIVRQANAQCENRVNVLVIMDDSCSRKQKFDQTILDMYTKGRHDNISIIYSVQDGSLVDNVWKENADFIFMFGGGTARTKAYIVDNILAGMIQELDFDSVRAERAFYRQLYRQITAERYRIVVADMQEMTIHHYKAPERIRRRRRRRQD